MRQKKDKDTHKQSSNVQLNWRQLYAANVQKIELDYFTFPQNSDIHQYSKIEFGKKQIQKFRKKLNKRVKLKTNLKNVRFALFFTHNSKQVKDKYDGLDLRCLQRQHTFCSATLQYKLNTDTAQYELIRYNNMHVHLPDNMTIQQRRQFSKRANFHYCSKEDDQQQQIMLEEDNVQRSKETVENYTFEQDEQENNEYIHYQIQSEIDI